LTDTLSGAGPFTVFAPTDAAFEAASAVIATLTEDQITDVLLYHVVGADALAADLTQGEKLASLFAPHNLTVATITPNVTIQPDGTGAADATVTGPDNMACNGVVHIIDAVLVPDLAAPVVTTPAPGNVTTPGPDVTTAAPATLNIVELAQSVPSLSTLVTLLIQQNLTTTLSGTGPFTVFAPNDDAFAAAADITAGLTSDQLTDVLTYHVVGAVEALAADLTVDESLATVFTDHSLTVATIAPDVTIHPDGTGAADATVISANNMATNGVVHIVNAVLVPALPASFNLQVV
jgi:transforming growth factor-beta-induced protein